DLAPGVDHDDLVRLVDEGHLHRALGHLVDREQVDPAGHAAALAGAGPAAHFASSRSRRSSRALSSGTRATTGSRKPSTMNLRASSGGTRRLSRENTWLGPIGPPAEECAARRQSGCSISSEGMATARAAFDRFMPNSPRNESVPPADFSIVIRPFMKLRDRSRSAPFDRRLPVVSRPRWRVYEVRSNSCCSPPKTISPCATELRSPSRRLSTRDRTSRP